MKFKILELEAEQQWIPKQKKGKGKSKDNLEQKIAICNLEDNMPHHLGEYVEKERKYRCYDTRDCYFKTKGKIPYCNYLKQIIIN